VNRKSGDRVIPARQGKENNSAAAVSTSQSHRRSSPRDEEASQDDLGTGARQSVPAAAASAEQMLTPADETWCEDFTHRNDRHYNPAQAMSVTTEVLSSTSLAMELSRRRALGESAPFPSLHSPLLLLSSTLHETLARFGCRRAEQLQRMQTALRAALAGDLAALKTAIQLYKEQVARLQCQKQLLLSQVRLAALAVMD